jgi:hypothetical protein
MASLLARTAARLLRLFLRLPRWLRPSVIGALVVLLIMGLRLPPALPKLLRGEESWGELALCLAAAAGAAALGGLGFAATGPLRRRLGRTGDLLSGVAILWSYLGSLLLASPYVFERSAMPRDLEGWLIFAAVATVIGLVAGFVWFRGEGFAEGAAERARPELVPLVRRAEDGEEQWALGIGGWIDRGDGARLLALACRVLGAPAERAHAERLASELRDDEPERALELELRAAAPVPLRLAPLLPGCLRFDLVLEHALEGRMQALAEALAELTVDPLTHEPGDGAGEGGEAWTAKAG